MIGDCLLMGVNTTGSAGILGGICMAAGKIGYMRIGLAGFFGFAAFGGAG